MAGEDTVTKPYSDLEQVKAWTERVVKSLQMENLCRTFIEALAIVLVSANVAASSGNSTTFNETTGLFGIAWPSISIKAAIPGFVAFSHFITKVEALLALRELQAGATKCHDTLGLFMLGAEVATDGTVQVPKSLIELFAETKWLFNANPMV